MVRGMALSVGGLNVEGVIIALRILKAVAAVMLASSLNLVTLSDGAAHGIQQI